LTTFGFTTTKFSSLSINYYYYYLLRIKMQHNSVIIRRKKTADYLAILTKWI